MLITQSDNQEKYSKCPLKSLKRMGVWNPITSEDFHHLSKSNLSNTDSTPIENGPSHNENHFLISSFLDIQTAGSTEIEYEIQAHFQFLNENFICKVWITHYTGTWQIIRDQVVKRSSQIYSLQQFPMSNYFGNLGQACTKLPQITLLLGKFLVGQNK